jgi:hypothetical protein
MYFDDFEADLDLANSFDALVDDELGQEVDVQVSIPQSSLPTPTETEVIRETGVMPQMTGLPGQAGRQRMDPIKQIGAEIDEIRAQGGDVDVKQFSEQRIAEWEANQAMGRLQSAMKQARATMGDIGDVGRQMPSTIVSAPRQSPEFADLQRTQMVDEIVKNVTQRLIPRLKKIDKRLKLAQSQAKATDEHNIIMERELFRNKVINDLKWLSQMLPDGHPVRARIDRL